MHWCVLKSCHLLTGGSPVAVKEQATLQHPIEATDRQIDRLVYEVGATDRSG
jgi:hypothetical protein